jgi:uncharacterized protein (TIGR00251 family)
MLDLQQHTHGVIVAVRASAGVRRNAILGVREGELRVAVTAAPEKGNANRAIVAVLSEALRIPKSAIQLISGETSQRKRFVITGGEVNAIRKALANAVEKAQ